jgi:predicted amidohydrolase
MSLTTVACCQVTLHIEDAVASGAQIVIVPELANSGYAFTDATEAQMLAEQLPRFGFLQSGRDPLG